MMHPFVGRAYMPADRVPASSPVRPIGTASGIRHCGGGKPPPYGMYDGLSTFVGRGLAPADRVMASAPVRSVGVLPISEGFGTVGNRPLRMGAFPL